MKLWILMILGVGMVSGGCAGTPKTEAAARPAAINHIVLMKLQDPSLVERLVEDVEDCDAYVAHRQHVAFVELWKPRLAQLRVYDVGDATPWGFSDSPVSQEQSQICAIDKAIVVEIGSGVG